MNTYLGISTELDQSAVDESLIKDSAILYLEGYLFDQPQAMAAFHHAVSTSKGAGRQVALTLSDKFCVDRHRAEFLALIRSGIDVVFANESEVTSLYETDKFDDAAAAIAKDTKLAVLTRSGKGSVILNNGSSIPVAVDPVAKVIDTTGAGDLYAAGFLYGLTSGRDLAASGKLGSIAAAEIISHVGARSAVSLAELAKQKGV